MMERSIRAAVASDAPEIFRMIHELAEFEHRASQFKLSEATLAGWLASGEIGCLLAESDGKFLGFALYYFTFSTFRGEKGIYLEDLYIRPEYRKQGIGRDFFRELAVMARKKGYFRIDWMVLDWNRDGIQFYRSLGAARVDDWFHYRLTGPALERMGEK